MRDAGGGESPIHRRALSWCGTRLRIAKSRLKAEWIEALAALAGVALAAYFFGIENHTRKEESKVEYTIDFVRGFQTAELIEARTALLAPLFDTPQIMAVAKDMLPGQGMDEALYVPMKEEVFRNAENYGHLLTILERYNAAILCVEADICNRDVMDQYLYKQLCTFHTFYRREIGGLASVLSIPGMDSRIVRYLREHGEEVSSSNRQCPGVLVPPLRSDPAAGDSSG